MLVALWMPLSRSSASDSTCPPLVPGAPGSLVPPRQICPCRHLHRHSCPPARLSHPQPSCRAARYSRSTHHQFGHCSLSRLPPFPTLLTPLLPCRGSAIVCAVDARFDVCCQQRRKRVSAARKSEPRDEESRGFIPLSHVTYSWSHPPIFYSAYRPIFEHANCLALLQVSLPLSALISHLRYSEPLDSQPFS
jgi:hypothetical protein